MFVEASKVLECCICLVVPITNQNDGSNNDTKQRKSTAVVDSLIHYKGTKTMKNLIISTFIIGSGLNSLSLVGDSSLLGCDAVSVGKYLWTL
jgi:hypothetical protein